MNSGRSWTLLRLAAVLVFGASSSAPAQAQELRIGFLGPMTGIFAQLGTDMHNGFQMYLDEHKVARRRQGDLDRRGHAGQAGHRRHQGQQAHPVGQGPHAGRRRAGDDRLCAGAGRHPREDALHRLDRDRRRSRAARLREISLHGAAHLRAVAASHPLGQWACDQGYKRITIIAADYAFGHETAGGFHKAFEDCGGKIVQRIWPPIGTKDFGPYIPTIKSDVDAIFTLMVGPMSLQFPKQLRAAGFNKPILGGGTNYDEFILPSMGDEVIGHVSAFMYSAALDTPKNAAFVKQYRTKYGKVPSYYSEANYTTAQWIDETLKKSDGKYPGPLEFIKTMPGIKLDAVRGPVSLDDRLTAVNNIYIKKVERKKMFGYDKDELWNTVIKTYPNVSQFWTYDKAAFLKQPLYSRDFPPCKYCD